jgi:hypothetical protein
MVTELLAKKDLSKLLFAYCRQSTKVSWARLSFFTSTGLSLVSPLGHMLGLQLLIYNELSVQGQQRLNRNLLLCKFKTSYSQLRIDGFLRTGLCKGLHRATSIALFPWLNQPKLHQDVYKGDKR